MSLMSLDDVRHHIRDRPYMGDIERDRLRIKATGEVFTPTDLVLEVLNGLPQELFTDPSKTFLDPSCGDGQFLGEVLIRKMENGHDFATALGTIYGVDIMADNVALCRERLLCGREDLRYIVERNIACDDALRYEYRFGPNITHGGIIDWTEVDKSEKRASMRMRRSKNAHLGTESAV